MLFLHLLLLGDNFFFFLLLLGLLPGLDLALLLPKNPLYLFSKAKGLQSLVFIINSLGQLFLPFLLDVILVHQRNRIVPPMLTFIAFKLIALKCCCLAMKVPLLIIACFESSSILSKTWKTSYSQRSLLMRAAQYISSTPPRVFMFLRMLIQIV